MSKITLDFLSLLICLIFTSKNHFKTQELPLARIKKIMKQDEEVKMISAEVCGILIFSL